MAFQKWAIYYNSNIAGYFSCSHSVPSGSVSIILFAVFGGKILDG